MATEGDDDDEFSEWLKLVGTKYKTLTSAQCNQTLAHLIQLSEGSQLYHIFHHLDDLLKRDFFSLLPREVSYYILQYLDAESLLACCSVSKTWADVVNSCTTAWRRVCHEAGLAVREESHDADFWRCRYNRCRHRLKALERGDSFQEKILFGHTDRVMAVCYYNGLLATGSDDHTVRIWDCSTGQCLTVIQTHTVAEVKFNNQYIFTASFDTTAACWDFDTGRLLNHYTGHVAAVFSIDYSMSLDIVITGSADSTIKVWRLSSAQLIQTLPHHRSNWIMQVRLVDRGQFSYILSRDNISIHMWQIATSDHSIINMKEWQKPYKDLIPSLQVSDKCVTYAGVDSDNICYIIQNDLDEPEVEAKQRISYHMHRDAYALGLLGSGAQYDVILTQGDVASIDVIRHSDKMLLTSKTLPSDYRQSKRMSTFCLGGRAWLDGFDGQNDEGVFFVTSLRDNSILILEWTPVSEEATA